jgi:hypothetical protein
VNLSVVFREIASFYVNGQYRRLPELNDLFINFCRLFVIAQMPDIKEKRRAFILLHRDIMKQQALLRTMLSYTDTVLKHPTMRGDIEYFSEIFGGSEAPKDQEMAEFKLWYSRTFGKGASLVNDEVPVAEKPDVSNF